MSTEKRWYLVSYDIRNQKRWRKGYKALQGRGERVHYSLFRCWMTRTELEALRWELEKVLEDEDDLMFVHLCPGCAERVQVKGEEEAESWTRQRKRLEIL